MMTTPNIVVIDDQIDQLVEIQNGFFAGGIPCLPIHYQYDLMNNKSGLDHVELGNFKPRIVVSDLNLREGSLTNVMELTQPIATLLQKLNIEGPYVLIFWSAVSESVTTVMDTLQQRFYGSTNLPIHYTCIDKMQFSGTANAASLKTKLKEIVSESKLFNALVDWEGRVALAAKETTNSLFKLTKPAEFTSTQSYQDFHVEKLQAVLAAIGNETVGVKNAAVEPEVALDTGLAPVLHDHLQSLSETQDRTIWLDAVPKIGTRIDSDHEVKAHLNSFYHIQEASAETLQSQRGAWIELKEEYISDPDKLTKLETNLGRPFKVILHDEFLNSRLGTQAERQAARDSTRLGFIELSAECDQAQKKTKLHKFLLSALIPIEHNRFTMFGEGGERDTAHSGVYRTPNLIINGQEYIVKVSFMYQIGVIPSIHKWLGAPKFRLKDQILADISYQCSQHASRPGIIRFD